MQQMLHFVILMSYAIKTSVANETMAMSHEWLIFLPQIPSSPSSLRVLVWRRMRAAGAIGLQNGVWVLPHRLGHEKFIRELLTELAPLGGSGLSFTATSVGEATDTVIIERARADRDQEYAEFCERCAEFLHELEKETSQKKFTYAELEENEDDLTKLSTWLHKIQDRDFFTGSRSEEALSILAQGTQALADFTQRVYDEAALGSTNHSSSEQNTAADENADRER